MTEAKDSEQQESDALRDALTRAYDDPADPEALAAMLAATEEAIAEDAKRPCAGLRCMPTWKRVVLSALLLGGIAAIGFFLFGAGASPIMDASLRQVVLNGALAVAGAGLLTAMLRPMHKAQASNLELGLWVGLGLSAALIAALTPPGHGVGEGRIGALGMHDFGCMAVGAVFGLPSFFIVRLFDRCGSLRTALLAALLGGMLGAFVTDAHCMTTHLTHRLATHFSLALVVVLVVAVGHLVVRRLRR